MPDDTAGPGAGESGGAGRRPSGGRRVFLVAVGLMLVLLGGTSLFVPLGPSSSALSVWQAHDLCSGHGGASGSTPSGSWAGPCADVAPVWGVSLVALAMGLVRLLASLFV